MLNHETLLARIEAHIAATGAAPSKVGVDIAGDPNFVFNLRKGREPRSATLRKASEKLDALSQQRAA
ncbi:MAG TPA: hypothetical protein VEA35_00555 [Ramlibacter sp.]|nr:hypothetical protein [Ramlibacter sp.]